MVGHQGDLRVLPLADMGGVPETSAALSAIRSAFPVICSFLGETGRLVFREVCHETLDLYAQFNRTLRWPIPVAGRLCPMPTVAKLYAPTIHLLPVLPSCLTFLDVSRCALSDADITPLLSTCPVLKYLNISFNPLRQRGVCAVLDALVSPYLTGFVASSCNMESAPDPRLSQKIRRVDVLHLEGNDFENSIDELYLFLKPLRSIVDLRIDATELRLPELPLLASLSNRRPSSTRLPRLEEVQMWGHVSPDLDMSRMHSLTLSGVCMGSAQWRRLLTLYATDGMCTTLCLNATNVYPSSIAAFLDGVKRPQLFERLILTKMDSLDLEIFECLCNIMICRGIRLKTLVAAYCEQLTMYPEDDPSIVIAAMHPDAEIFDIGRDPVFPGRESMFVEAILQRLPNLTDVGLSGRQLLLDEFPLTQVKRLDISNTTTNWFPMALPHLQHIDFSMQTGDSSLTLNAALGNMAIERVTAMFVSLESPIIAGRCNYLQILNLNYSNLSRTFRRSFAEYMSQGGMPSLQHLCVMSDQEYHHRWTRRLVRVMSSHARRCVIDAKGKAWTDEGAFQQLLNIHRDHYSPGALHAIRINVAASLYSLFEAHTHKGSWRITVTQ